MLAFPDIKSLRNLKTLKKGYIILATMVLLLHHQLLAEQKIKISGKRGGLIENKTNTKA